MVPFILHEMTIESRESTTFSEVDAETTFDTTVVSD